MGEGLNQSKPPMFTWSAAFGAIRVVVWPCGQRNGNLPTHKPNQNGRNGNHLIHVNPTQPTPKPTKIGGRIRWPKMGGRIGLGASAKID